MSEADRRQIDAWLGAIAEKMFVEDTAYIAYCNYIEERWTSSSHHTEDDDLGAELWTAFAFLDRRFLNLDHWSPGDGQHGTSPAIIALWRFRSSSLADAFRP